MILARKGSPYDIDPLLLPSISIEKTYRLPSQPGIYFVMSPTKEVLYIGKSRNILSRWSDHHRIEDFSEVGTRIAYRVILDNVDLERIEYELIQFHKPKLNNKRNPHRLLLNLSKEDGQRLDKLSKFYKISRPMMAMKLLQIAMNQALNSEELQGTKNSLKITIE